MSDTIQDEFGIHILRHFLGQSVWDRSRIEAIAMPPRTDGVYPILVGAFLGASEFGQRRVQPKVLCRRNKASVSKSAV